MTGDPERLLRKTGEGTAVERELLESLTALEPHAGAMDGAWTGIVRSVPALGAGAAASLVSAQVAALGNAGSATAKASLGVAGQLAQKSVLLKVLVGLGVGAAGVGATWRAVREAAPVSLPARVLAKSAIAPAAAIQAAPLPAVPPVPSCAGSTCQPEPPASKGRPSRSALGASERADLLGRESALLVRARAELRAGSAARAEATLRELDARFPRGMLGQEREVLAIELLVARGDRRSAEHRAKAFVLAHPKSPHSAKLGRFLSAP